MAVSLQQAACNALGSRLSSVLGPGVKVNYDWPDPEAPLPAKGVTILLAGQADDFLLQPEIISSTQIDSVNRLYRWKVLERTQPIQLDVWSTYQAVRDDMVASLDQALHAGWDGTPNCGLVLTLADGWEGCAVFDFDGPNVTNSGPLAQVSEFRAMYPGELRAVLYVDAPSPRIARLKLHQVLSGQPFDSTLF